jgi:hypothetical protein
MSRGGLRALVLLGAALYLGCEAAPVDSEEPESIGETADALGQYPVCGTTQVKASGLPWSPCSSLDTECLRGAWDPSSKCCHLVARAEGTTCTQGVCDGLGKCDKPKDPKDKDGDKIDDSKDPLLGKAGWIQAYGNEPSSWHDIFTPNRLELRLAEEPVAWVPTQPQFDLSKLEIAVAPDPKKREAVFISTPAPWAEVELDGGSKFEVCVAKPNLAPDAPLPADCKGPNVQRLACPTQVQGGLECTFEQGLIRVKGPKLRFVWLPIDGDSKDIRLLMLPMLLPIEICKRCKDLPGHFPPPLLFIERCNGVDDDNDGLVDEGGSALCDDHINCTDNVCSGTAGCTYPPRTGGRFCNAGPDCLELQCNAPLVAGPGEEAFSEPDENGCYKLLRHGFCNDTWDGCACNGAEKCDPWHAPTSRTLDPWAESQGCVADTPLLELPCEQLNGDGNGCSPELCCEDWDPAGCRLHRKIQEHGTAAVDAYQAACDWPFGASSGEIFCPDDPFRHPPGSYGAHCNDGNPCTTDTCNAPSGSCSNPALPNGDQPGCGGLIGKGCGSQSCEFGICRQSTRTPDASDPFQCHDSVAIDWGPLVGPTCLRYQCSNINCTMVPQPSQCDDGLFCNGAETCSLARVFEQDPSVTISAQSVPSLGHWWGCGTAPVGPCDDGKGCTTDFCNETSNSCSHDPNDFVCHASRGLSYHPCSPDFRCECTGPECGTPQADGCSPLPAAYSPCNDGNICTFDTCTCADEFCEFPACGHSNICGTGGLPGVGGFGGVGNFGG